MGADADETLQPAGVAGASAAARPFAPGAHVAGRYRIDRFIASGAMGDVYAAEDLIVGGMVALKTVRPELEGSATALERLRREIALARTVTNAHVCRLHDVGEHEGRAFITMELLDGTTLAELVRERGALPADEVERLARQLIAGLAALHAGGIVHRDFKTANVIVVGERAVITDFGLARSIRPDAMASLTVEASLLGTPAYMAPEQVEGRPATPASDIYALGVVLFELLTGRVPFREDTALATATARLQKDPPRPSSVRAGIPARWDARVLRCLAREPADRFARVEDVLDAPVGVPTRRWVLAAAGAGLAGLGIGAWKMFGGAREPGPLAAGELVAVLPVAGAGPLREDPLRLALTVDLEDALATSGLPILALDAAAMFALLDGTAMRVDARTAWDIREVAAVVELAIASTEPLAIDVTLHRRGGAGWTKRLARPATEAMLLVEDIARAIARSLGPFAIRHAADAVATAAYPRYGAALAALLDLELTEPARAGDQLRGSTAALEAVVAAEPRLARAHAWLAERYANIGQEVLGGAARDYLQKAREAADRALAVDPDQPLAHTARGRAAMFQWDWQAAEDGTRRGVELAPTNARTTLTRAFYLHLVGRFDDGFALFESNFARNSRAPSAIGGMGWGYYYGRRYQRAIDHLAPLVAGDKLKEPGAVEVASWVVLSYAEMSRYAEAFAAAARLRAVTRDPQILATIVPAYVMAGRLADARAIVDEVKATGHPYTNAIALDAIGDIDGALPLLEKVVDDHDDRAVFLKIDRFSAIMRSQPRFQALIARVGFPS